MVYLLKMVIFHSYVAVYQRVKLQRTMDIPVKIGRLPCKFLNIQVWETSVCWPGNSGGKSCNGGLPVAP